MSKKRFYFAIKEANVFECIWADSFTKAKQIAAADWYQDRRWGKARLAP